MGDRFAKRPMVLEIATGTQRIFGGLLMSLMRNNTATFKLFDCVSRMYDDINCFAIASHLGETLASIAKHVDGRVNVWGDLDWHTSPEAAVDGHMDVDYHVRRWLTSTAVTSGKAPTPMQATRLVHNVDSHQAKVYRDLDCCAVLAAGHMASLASDLAIGMTWDGVRIGNPPKEWNYTLIRNRDTSATCVLPPAVQLNIYRLNLVCGRGRFWI